MGWINVAHDRDKWQGVVNVVMKFQVHIMLGISWLAKELLASPEGLCSILSVSQSVSQAVSKEVSQLSKNWKLIIS